MTMDCSLLLSAHRRERERERKEYGKETRRKEPLQDMALSCENEDDVYVDIIDPNQNRSHVLLRVRRES